MVTATSSRRDSPVSEVLNRLRARIPEMVRLLEELVTSESPSNDTAAVHATATLLAERGTAILGQQPEWLARSGSPVLRWRIPAQGGAGGRPVLLLGHLDTVWPLGTITRWPFSVADGRANGPGAFDMKAGLVQGLFAMAELGQSGRSSPGVDLLVTSDEEIGSPSGRRFVEDAAAEAAAVLVLEASAAGRLKLARKGVGIYRLKVTGRAAHAGLEPEKGINALTVAADVVLRLGAIADVGAGTTVTPTLAVAGTTQNTVPAEAVVTVDVRAVTVAEQQRVDRELRALPVPAGARLAVTGGTNRPPLESSASTALFAMACTVAPRCGIAQLDGVAVGGGSDGNFTAALGVPTLDGIGAVGDGAHAEGEYVLVAEMAERAALVTELVAAHSGAGTPGKGRR
jgi:glutamate carboxypeptidase